MNKRNVLIFILSLIFLIYILGPGVEYSDVTFNQDNTQLENQYKGQQGFDHLGLDELYAHMYAAAFLFIAGTISSILLFERFGKSRFTWRPVIAGIFVTGMLGLGEIVEHFFHILGHEFFHYTHMLGGILAMYFLYIGTQEYPMQYRQGGKPIKKKVITGLILIVPLLSFTIALNSGDAWDERVEMPFLYLTAVPTIFLAGMTFIESYRQKEAHKVLMGFLAILALTVTTLVLVILAGRVGDLANHAFLYVIGQSLQVVFLSATAMLISIFTFTMWTLCNE